MDWLYVWAYFRIADRKGRRAKDTSDQLAKLAHADWVIREPKRGYGLWEGSAWGTHAGFKRAGIRDPRNFFLATKPFVKKLKEFVSNRRLMRRLQIDFRGVFGEDPDDIAALRAIGRDVDELRFKGFVLVGWGVPKGIVWIGLANRRAAWNGTPEERAIELLLPARQLPLPSTILGDRTPESLLSVLIQPSMCREVVRAHLAALGFHEGVGTKPDWVRDGRRYGSGLQVDEFLLVDPSPAELSHVRLRQLRGELKPLWIVDHELMHRAITHFPWLWKGRWDCEPDTQETYAAIPPHPRWSDLHRLQLIVSAAHLLNLPVDDSVVAALWPEATSVHELLLELNKTVPSSTRPEDGPFRSLSFRPLTTFLLVDEKAFFLNPTLTALLRAASECAIAVGDSSALDRCAVIWHDRDAKLAARARERRQEIEQQGH